MEFPGLAIGGYRSFYDPVWIDVSGGLNVFLGSNNSGKSNALRVLTLHAKDVFDCLPGNKELSSFDVRLDRPSGQEEARLAVHWPIDPDRVIADLGADKAKELLEYMVHDFPHPTFPFAADSLTSRLTFGLSFEKIQSELGNRLNLGQLSTQFTHSSGGASGQDAERVFRHLMKTCLISPPTVRELPLRRQVAIGENWDTSGAGAVNLISQLKNADFDHPEHREQALAVEALLRKLLDDDELELLPLHNQSSLNVGIGGRHLPLASFGSGVEELVLIALARLRFPNDLLVMEEPDVHLHPRLQHRLAAVLRDHPTGRTVIATHSSHMIDVATDNTQCVSIDGGTTRITRVGSTELFEQLRSLGYRASDLLQANCILWVEGPSDRIYLNHWLSQVAPELREGIEYSVMFFGGNMLSHLQAEVSDEYKDPDLIDLWRLNQNMAVIVDSDRTNADKPLKARVERLNREIEDAQSDRAMTWITDERTIENYIDDDLLLNAVKSAHPSVISIDHESGIDVLTRLRTKKGTYLKSPDKVAIARAVVDQAPAPNDQLRTKIEEVVGLVRRANV